MDMKKKGKKGRKEKKGGKDRKEDKTIYQREEFILVLEYITSYFIVYLKFHT